MRKLLVKALAVVFCCLPLACGGPDRSNVSAVGNAITNGTLDGEGHPYVGALEVLVDGAWKNRCSGSLISSTVYLMAGHCVTINGLLTLPHDRWGVVFDSYTFSPTRTMFTGTAYLHPQYAASGGQAGGQWSGPTNDVAVIVLDTPVTDRGLAALPAAGLLTELAEQGGLHSQLFTNVGYGVIDNQQGGHVLTGSRGYRRTSTSLFQAMTPDVMMSQANEALGLGGMCYIDSGGPQLFEGTNLIAAIAHGGDAMCQAIIASERIDTDAIRSFLANFVQLP